MATYNKRNRRLYYDKAMSLYFEQEHSVSEISKLFSVAKSTIRYWISTFAKEKSNKGNTTMERDAQEKSLSSPDSQSTDIRDMDAEALRKELASMKKKLADAELKAELYNEIINVAEKKFNISIRKKAGTKQ